MNTLGEQPEWARPDLSPEAAQNFWDSLDLKGREALLRDANSQIGTTEEVLADYYKKNWKDMPDDGRTPDVRKWIQHLGRNPEKYKPKEE